jgi:hypothetical protein
MTNKDYKAIFVPVELHKKVKLAALKNNLSMIAFLEKLLSKSNPINK